VSLLSPLFYGKVRGVLQFDFSFAVPGQGNIRARGNLSENLRLAIVGPSGCGKSTFLKALCSLGPKISGEVRLQGKELNQALLQEGVLGFSFQNSPLFPHLDVSENLSLPFKTLKKFREFSPSLQSEKVLEALARANLIHLAKRWPHDLSGGERKRISLLRSMIFDPPLLVLDEPFSDLDEENRIVFKDWLAQMTKDRKGILIYVTHSKEDLSLSNAQKTWPESGANGDLNFGNLPN
jgi:ABC-type sugar transport system ATPase subunit